MYLSDTSMRLKLRWSFKETEGDIREPREHSFEGEASEPWTVGAFFELD